MPEIAWSPPKRSEGNTNQLYASAMAFRLQYQPARWLPPRAVDGAFTAGSSTDDPGTDRRPLARLTSPTPRAPLSAGCDLAVL